MTKTRTITLFLGKISKQFALFYEKFTRLTRILHDRRSQRSRQISTLRPGPQSESASQSPPPAGQGEEEVQNVTDIFWGKIWLDDFAPCKKIWLAHFAWMILIGSFCLDHFAPCK